MLHKHYFALLLLLAGTHTCTFAQSNTPLYYPPLTGTNWASTLPSDLGFCAERIDSLYAFLDQTNAKSFILLKDGKIVLEKYFDNFTRDSFWYWASAGKSLSAFLIGQAQEEGLIDIAAPASDYLGNGWTACTAEQENQITVWHQLTMSSGLDDAVPDDNCTDPACLVFKAAPGARWAYHNAPYHLLHDVIEAASGKTLNQFTKSHILDKTGMKGIWVDHVQYGRARDMARFGLLCLGNGVWDGDTLLHDTAYLNAMSRPSQLMNKSYGYLWWLNGQPSFMLPSSQIVFPGKLVPNAPDDLYAALGKNDQKIHVVPSRGWVIVRQGDSAGSGNLNVPTVFDNLMWGKINALVCTPSATNEAASIPALVVAPTASTDYWQVQAEQHILRIEVLDLHGKICGQYVGCNSTEQKVGVGQLASGIYLLRVLLENGSTVQRKVMVLY